jgi:hypothetical protein
MSAAVVNPVRSPLLLNGPVWEQVLRGEWRPAAHPASAQYRLSGLQSLLPSVQDRSLAGRWSAM